MRSRFTVSARLYSVRMSRASLSPWRSHCLQRRTASAPSIPSISSALDMPRSISSGFRPPRYPSLREANLRSNCGRSRSTSGKLLLSTGTSKQLPLNVTRTDAPSRASASASGVRSSPSVRVTVPSFECTVTRVTSASLLRPSVSMSRYFAPPRRSPNILQRSALGSIPYTSPYSPERISSFAWVSRQSPRDLASGRMAHTLSDERKSPQVSTPDSQMAISFLAPTEGRRTKVFRINAGASRGEC